jgi:hypothetical protein
MEAERTRRPRGAHPELEAKDIAVCVSKLRSQSAPSRGRTQTRDGHLPSLAKKARGSNPRPRGANPAELGCECGLHERRLV